MQKLKYILKKPKFAETYRKHTKELLKGTSRDRGQRITKKQALSLAVGGEFDAVGILEYCMLIQEGLQKQDTVVDVGCGSGRLAFQLKEYLAGPYVGTDVVPDLYKYAQNICKRPDWKFLSAPGLTIPVPDDFADYICFFSVFTHLLYEESYRYLEDAKRALKPGGKVIFSFLEFVIPSHWDVFQASLADDNPDKVFVQFMSREAIKAWAERLDLKILKIADGDKPSIHLDRVVRWDSGLEMKEMGNLGQSICVLTK